MTNTTRSTLSAALAAALILAVPSGPAVAQTAGQQGAAMVQPAQAEAPQGWARHTERGLVIWLPEPFARVHDDENGVIFANTPRPGPGTLAVMVSDSPETYARFMRMMADVPPEASVSHGSRDIGRLGSFEEATYDLRDVPGAQPLFMMLVAPEPDTAGRRLMLTLQASAPREEGASNWAESRALFEDILSRITDSSG